MATRHATDEQGLLPGRAALAAAEHPRHESECPGHQPASGPLCNRMLWLYDSGPVCLTAAAFVFAVAAALVKALPRTPLLEVIFLRSVVTCAASYASARAANIQPLLGHQALWPLLALRGACGEAAAMFVASVACSLHVSHPPPCRVCGDAAVLHNLAAAHSGRCRGPPVRQPRVLRPPGLVGAGREARVEDRLGVGAACWTPSCARRRSHGLTHSLAGVR